VETGDSGLGYTELRVPKGFDQDTKVVVKGAYAILSKMKNSEEAGHAH
jgi:cobalt-zinc-cadmium efflux system membrane fusion protein